jgi:uncharacterized protein
VFAGSMACQAPGWTPLIAVTRKAPLFPAAPRAAPAGRATESTATYDFDMWLLAEERERRSKRDTALADRTRALLRAALARHVPGTTVWVYGSLIKPGRFHEWSDVDIAVESLPVGMSLEYLQSLLSADVEREVDVCFLDRTRLRPFIEREGERWIA